VFKNRLGVGLV